MPFLIALWIAAFGWWIFSGIQSYEEYQDKVVAFEERCASKDGLTLQAKKNGVDWIGCYKDGKELYNEE